MSDLASATTETANHPTETQQTLIGTDFWTAADTARQLNMSERQLARHRSKRTGPPPIRVGNNTVVYARDSVLAWLKSLEEPRPTPRRKKP
jgi:predicted DNA-binding transcriptional regulator AlpA